MSKSKYDHLTDFLIKNFNDLACDTSSGASLDFPEFDLMPFDYLEFAEQELENSNTASKINCISHLKRAVECQLDTLLCILGATKIATNFPRKLEFASEAGIISSRSLAKINKIRNRVEHEYAEPNEGELEAYYDIACGFIHTIEGNIFILANKWDMDWGCQADRTKCHLRAEIKRDQPVINFIIQDNEIDMALQFDASASMKEYCQGLKAYLLLCRAEDLLSAEYFLSKLRQGSAGYARPQPN